MNTSFATVGHLSRAARTLPSDILAVANRLGVTPAMVIDGRPLFSDEDARRIISAVARPPVAGGHLAARANNLS